MTSPDQSPQDTSRDTGTTGATGTKASLTMSPRATARLRSGLTLLVLAGIVVVAVAFGVSALTAPVEETEETAPPVCDVVDLEAGQPLMPRDVTVSVLNSSNRDGLAGRTLSDLSDAGFDSGQESNAPEDTDVTGVQIWTAEPRNPAVRLVRTYLGGRVRVRDEDGGVAGVTVVVGDDFSGVKQGRQQVVVRRPSTVCGPTP